MTHPLRSNNRHVSAQNPSAKACHGEEIPNAGGVKHGVNRIPRFVSQIADDSDTIPPSLVGISRIAKGRRNRTPFAPFHHGPRLVQTEILLLKTRARVTPTLEADLCCEMHAIDTPLDGSLQWIYY